MSAPPLRSPWSARAIGLLAGCVSLVPLYLVSFVTGTYLAYFQAGADIYGELPEPTPSWYEPAMRSLVFGPLLIGACVAGAIATIVSKRRRRRGLT